MAMMRVAQVPPRGGTVRDVERPIPGAGRWLGAGSSACLAGLATAIR